MVDPDTASRFDEIYDSTNRSVMSFITAKCGNTADIHDIFQDTYMELYKLLNKRGVEYVTNEKALVFKIAKRKIARYYSLLERFRIWVSLSVKDENEEEIKLSDFAADSFVTEDFAINKIVLDEARKYIQSKPEDIKKVLYLFYDMNLTIRQIAAELNISESNVKHKLYRTLEELRKLLQ